MYEYTWKDLIRFMAVSLYSFEGIFMIFPLRASIISSGKSFMNILTLGMSSTATLGMILALVA